MRALPRLALGGGAALVVLALAALPHAGTALVVARPLTDADAIVSLASHEWERLPAAARLAAEHPDAVVLLTVPAVPTPFNCHDCANRVDRLRHLGVAAERVQLVPIAGAGTQGEAEAVAAFVRERGLERLLVVTSPYHTRRSLAVFESALGGTGVRVGIEPARATSPANPGRWWRAGYDRAYVAYEWAAAIYYSVRYGVPL